jgi:hypothetical protein
MASACVVVNATDAGWAWCGPGMSVISASRDETDDDRARHRRRRRRLRRPGGRERRRGAIRLGLDVRILRNRHRGIPAQSAGVAREAERSAGAARAAPAAVPGGVPHRLCAHPALSPAGRSDGDRAGAVGGRAYRRALLPRGREPRRGSGRGVRRARVGASAAGLPRIARPRRGRAAECGRLHRSRPRPARRDRGHPRALRLRPRPRADHGRGHAGGERSRARRRHRPGARAGATARGVTHPGGRGLSAGRVAPRCATCSGPATGWPASAGACTSRGRADCRSGFAGDTFCASIVARGWPRSAAS